MKAWLHLELNEGLVTPGDECWAWLHLELNEGPVTPGAE